MTKINAKAENMRVISRSLIVNKRRRQSGGATSGGTAVSIAATTLDEQIGGYTTTSRESSSFNVTAGKVYAVFCGIRPNGSGTTPSTTAVTVGTPSRTVGTGTALTGLTQSRNGNQEFAAGIFTAASTGSQSIIQEFGDTRAFSCTVVELENAFGTVEIFDTQAGTSNTDTYSVTTVTDGVLLISATNLNLQVLDTFESDGTELTEARTGTSSGFDFTYGIHYKSIANAGAASLTPTWSTAVFAGVALAIGVTDINDVSSAAELESALEDAALAYGDTIYVRAGTYAGVTATRTAPPTGTFNGSNHVKITPFPGDTPILNQFRFNGTEINHNGFDYDGLTFDTNVTGVNLASLNIDGGSNNTIVQNCIFAPQTGTWSETDTSNLVSACRLSVGLNHDNFSFLNNDINGAVYGLYCCASNATIQGNEIQKMTDDGIHITLNCPGLQIIGNHIHSALVAYSVYSITGVTEGSTTTITTSSGTFAAADSIRLMNRTTGELLSIDEYPHGVTSGGSGTLTINVDTGGDTAWTTGGEIWKKTAHMDPIQINGVNVAGRGDDIVIRGNRTQRGDTTEDWHGLSGVLGSNNTVDFDNALVEGNEFATEQVTGFNLGAKLTNSTIRYNVVAGVPNSWGPRQGTPLWFINADDSVIEGNLGHGSSISGTGNTETNNDFTIVDSAVALDAAYNAPQVTSVDASLAADAYAIESGSAADLASPKRGASPHQSFVSPWTFTAP